MNQHTSPVIRLLALVSVLLASFIFSAASAQDAPTEIEFRISSFTCASDPGQVSMAAGNIPDSCTPDSGVAFSVTLQDGTAVGTCATDASGLCILMAPNEATVVVTLDTATLAGSVAPRENPITTQVVTEFAGALFINLPSTPAPTAVPAELPGTGTGSAADSSQIWLAAATVVTLVSAAVAVGIRRQRA